MTQARQAGEKTDIEKDSIYGIVTLFHKTSYNAQKGILTIKAAIIIDQETQKVKFILDWKAGNVGQKLTVSYNDTKIKNFI